jgi:hypothetical protein
MSDPYTSDPQSSQWQRRMVDPSLPLSQQETFDGYPAPPMSAQQVQVPHPNAVPGQGDGFAISSLILGIVSASIGWIPLCGIVALGPAIVGIVLGSLGLKSVRHRYLAIAGIILSVIGVALSMLISL